MQNFPSAQSSERARATYEDIPVEQFDHAFSLGPYNTSGLITDPRRIGFLFARYKFAAKCLEGRGRVLEVGCQEGLGTLVVAQAVEHVVATDFYRPHIESCQARFAGFPASIEFRWHDILDGPVAGPFGGALSLDVLEHIDPGQEEQFIGHIAQSLTDHGVLVLGTPSLESQPYASPASKAGHINCKTGAALRGYCQRHFHTVFMFGMNDEVLHTGFLPMAHYLLALCVSPKRL